jgi:hypothetical protein
VIGDPVRAHALAQRLELLQVAAVEGIRAADRHRHAVQHDRIALGHAVEDPERPALRVHEVLGEDLEPVDLRPLLQDVAEVHGPQADADAEVRKVEAVRQVRCAP